MDSAAEHRASGRLDIPRSDVDFERPLVCVLGLPFDAVNIGEAVQRIRDDAFAGRRCFVSTPNLNFAMGSRSDHAFRDSVLRSDLSLIDGMPLVWIARMLGLPVPSRVAGSDLFEALQAHPGPRLSVYLFGGPSGAAELACQRINERGGGVRCVGFDAAGFGSIESMSADESIARINRSGAHFVIVSLGAKKGQAWIERNAARLAAPVLSHLGAVVNFSAGTIGRAPHWARRAGLEWLWRVKGEPSLWRRYGRDAAQASGLLVTRVLPDVIASRFLGAPVASTDPVEVSRGERRTTIRPVGGSHVRDIAALRAALAACADCDACVTIDLSRVATVGNAFVALLLVAKGWFERRGGFEVVGANRAVTASLRRKLAEHILLANG